MLFLNGIPVATVELKTDFTQSVDDAIDQYRVDRHPKPKGQAAEPLLSFPSGALVHFAVSNDEAHMVTKLLGPATEFLPFNKGDDGAKGSARERFRHHVRRVHRDADPCWVWDDRGMALMRMIDLDRCRGHCFGEIDLPRHPPAPECAEKRSSRSTRQCP